MIDLAILSGGVRIPLATNDATDATISDGAHGDEQAHVTLPRTLVEGLAVYEAPLLQLVASEHGAPIATYRLEQPALSDAQLELTALGGSRGYSDSNLTALWSSMELGRWHLVTRDEVATADSKKFEFDAQDRLMLALQKNTSYGNAPWTVGELVFEPPAGGSRQLIGASWEYTINLPVGWTFRWGTWTAGFGAFTSLGTLASTGAVQQGALYVTFAANDLFILDIFRNAANAVSAPETGDAYVKIFNPRVVTTTANAISTTLTAARAAGASVTATVGSTARMYVGQRLTINSGATPSEAVVVEQVLSATQFVATFANSYAIGNAVQAFVVYPDEVARSLVSAFASFNPAQVSTNTAQIQICAQDQTDLVYEDTAGDAVLDLLEGRADWRWAVRNRLLSFAPIGTNAQTWYVDATTYTVQRNVDALANVTYVTYQDAAGATQRTALARDDDSFRRFGVARARAVTADTTNATLAAAQRDRDLAASANPVPQTSIAFDTIYTALGARVPPWMVRADDVLIIRNLPPQAAQSRDAIRALLITRREVNLIDGGVTVEAQPLYTIERLIGRDT